MKITIRVKSIYGLETYYPACPAAELFAKIAGTKTITAHAIADIRALGYEIAVKTDAPKVLRALAIVE